MNTIEKMKRQQLGLKINDFIDNVVLRQKTDKKKYAAKFINKLYPIAVSIAKQKSISIEQAAIEYFDYWFADDKDYVSEEFMDLINLGIEGMTNKELNDLQGEKQ